MDEITLLINYISNIKEFDENDSSQLPDLISQIDTLIEPINSLDPLHKNIIFGYIKNKCIGQARDALHLAISADSWAEIKTVLKNDFGERKPVSELMDELLRTKLNGTIEQMFHRIDRILARIANRKLTHNDYYIGIENIKTTALKIFTENLPEPTKSLIIIRKPDNIKEAFNIIRVAKHTQYTKNNNAYSQVKINKNSDNYRNNNYNNYRNNNYNNYRTNNDNFRNNNYNNYRNNNYNNDRTNNDNQRNNNYNNNRINNDNQRTNTYNNLRTNNEHQRNDNYRNNNTGYNNNSFRNNNYHGNSNNYRNTNYNNNHNSNQSGNTIQTKRTTIMEPMEIGQNATNFPEEASSRFLT